MARGFNKPRINKTDRVAQHGRHTIIRGILHSTEGLCGTAPAIPGFWRRQGLGLGTQYIIDCDGYTIQCVPDDRIAYGCAGRNTGSIQWEQVGFASLTLGEWLSRRHKKQLKQVAKWMAWVNKTYGVPLRWDVNRGFSTHAMQSAVFTPGGHTDPGPHYPKNHVMRWAKWYRITGWFVNPNL